MITGNLKISTDLIHFLAFPENAFRMMSGVEEVYKRFEQIIQGSIMVNFDIKKNMDGSTWKPWSPVTAAYRRQGILKIDNPIRRGTSSTLLVGRGMYRDVLTKDISTVGHKTVSGLYTPITTMHMKLNSSVLPQLKNEYDYINETGNFVPARQVVFWNEYGIEQIEYQVTDSFDEYWGLQQVGWWND